MTIEQAFELLWDAQSGTELLYNLDIIVDELNNYVR